MTQQDHSQFHAAEVAVQKRFGVAEMVAQYSEGFIRETMPQQHREFFCELPFVILGLVDEQGYPWAIPLFGEEGFISSPNDTTLTFNALPQLTRLLALDFRQGQKVGMLGIQLATRRRNRMNGVIGEISERGFSVSVEQSFGNCPQYIQTRKLVWQANDAVREDFSDLDVYDQVDLKSKTLIEKADTFFIASRTQQFDEDRRSGIDASHRGGKPGFVKVEGNRLYFPDFSGNRFFNTLGNIESDGRVGLFFPDFSTSDAVLIAGKAEILWDHDAIDTVEGAERIIAIDAERVVHIAQFMALTGELIELSPVLDHTGIWGSAEQNEEPMYQPFKIVDKQKESDAITSFYFAPTKGAVVKNYIPGQFLPIRLNLPAQQQAVLRSYTLSRAPAADTYCISVKREAQGLASKSSHNQFNVGDTVNVGQPAGQFTLQQNDHACVFISGGVGITPMIAMLEGVINDVKRDVSPRPVWFIHGTQNSETRAFAEYVDTLSNQYDWLNVHTVFSRPSPIDVLGRTHQSERHVSIDLLKQILSFDQYDFYLCGSEEFMRSIYAGLVETGVAKTQIFYAFFGEGSIEEIDEDKQVAATEQIQVRFAKADRSGKWTLDEGSLLDFAEKQGLTPLYSCRSGNCGTCYPHI